MFFPRPGLVAALIILISYIFFNPTKIGNEVETVSLGVSLAANHGTISIRRNDGTLENIGRVDGDEAYLELMQRLSLDSSRHPAFVLPTSIHFIN